MKMRKKLTLFFFITVIGLGGYLFYSNSEGQINSYVRFDNYQKPVQRIIASRSTGARLSGSLPVVQLNSKAPKFLPKKDKRKHQTRGDEINLVITEENVHLEQQTLDNRFKIAGSEYAVVKNYHAIESTEESRAQFPNARVFAGHLFVEADAPFGDSLKVVQQKENRNLGIVTNVLKISFRGVINWESLSELDPYDIVLQDEELSKVFLKFRNYDALLRSYHHIKNNSDVRRAEIDILEHIRHSR